MKFFKTIFLLVPLTVLLSLCKKDQRVLGTDVRPAGDENHSNVTKSGIIAFTETSDSLLTFRNSGIKFIGSNIDPHLGRIDVGLYLNSTMSLTAVNFGTDPQLESAEIMLAVHNSSYTGDVNAVLDYTVYPLDSSLKAGRFYFTSNKRLHNRDSLVATYSGSLSLHNGKPVIRIPVNATYAKELITHPENLTSNEVYQSVHKGFYITAAHQPGSQGALFRANLEDSISGLFISYRPAPGDEIKKFRFTFSGKGAARFNTTTYDVTGADANLKDQLAGDTAKGKSSLFLLGMDVLRIKVMIPYLKNRSDTGTWSVNRAEIIFKVDGSYIPTDGRYNPPHALTLLALDSIGREIPVLDYFSATDRTRYDGKYDATNKRYVFNIARHAQGILDGKIKNYGFHLCVAAEDVIKDARMERVVLGGYEHSSLKPEFNLSYLILKN